MQRGSIGKMEKKWKLLLRVAQEGVCWEVLLGCLEIKDRISIFLLAVR